MSLSQEIARIEKAKQDLQSSLYQRGISTENKRLSDYADLLNSATGVAKGAFISDIDTNTFELKDLPFEPRTFIITCQELYKAPIANSIVSISQQKEMNGVVSHVNDWGTAVLAHPIGEATAAVVFDKNSLSIEIPFSVGLVFKANYLYTWIIAGGFEE